jgi:phosphoenolpyruvate-protein phosphotransferase (PTS system enzyme I)
MIQEPISTEEIHLQGIPVSPGIALGKIRIQIKGSKEPVAYDIEPDEVDSELVRFHRALQTTAVQIRALRERMIQISGEKEAAIFDAHILLLQDKIILDQVRISIPPP